MKIFLSQLMSVRPANRLDPSNLHSLALRPCQLHLRTTTKKVTYISRLDIFCPFGFSNRLVGNLLYMNGLLLEEYITHEVGTLTAAFFLEILASFSKVSRTYSLVNL